MQLYFFRTECEYLSIAIKLHKIKGNMNYNKATNYYKNTFLAPSVYFMHFEEHVGRMLISKNLFFLIITISTILKVAKFVHSCLT